MPERHLVQAFEDCRHQAATLWNYMDFAIVNVTAFMANIVELQVPTYLCTYLTTVQNLGNKPDAGFSECLESLHRGRFSRYPANITPFFNMKTPI